MTEATFHRPQRALLAWALLVLAAYGLVAAGDWVLFHQVSRMREQSPWTYLKEAERLERQNNWLGALEMLEEAARRAPDSPVPHERMGLIHYNRQRDWDKALEAFRKALELGSRSADVRGKIIWSLIRLGRHEGAAEFGAACIDDGYTAPEFPRYVAEAWWRAGKPKKAIPYFQQALEGFPNDLYLMERLMEAHRKAGNQAAARKMQQRIDELMER